MIGDIVLARHYDLFNKYKYSYFLVIYDEELDTSNSHTINITALKITSKDTNLCYEVPLDLKKPSHVLCSKFYTLNKSQVLSVIGHINDLKLVQKEIKRYYKEIRRQLKCLK